MKIAVLSQHGFEILEREIPMCGKDKVLVRIIACGVCSGDVFLYKTRVEADVVTEELGHEGSGVVVDVGQNVPDLSRGDVVTTFGMPAYADYLATTPEKVVKLPPEIDPITALGEPKY